MSVHFEGIEPPKAKTPKSAPSDVSPLPPMTSFPPTSLSRPNGLGVFSRGPEPKFNWLWAKDFVIALQSDYMEKVLSRPNMPSYSAINAWCDKYPKFKEWIARSRRMFASKLAEQSASMFDEAPPMEETITKHGVIKRISMSGVQRERYKSQAMMNLASKFDPDTFGDKVNISNTFDLAQVLTAVNGRGSIKKAKRVNEAIIEAKAEPPTQL